MNNKNYFLFGSFFFLAILLIFKNQQVAEGQNIVQPTYDAFANTQVSNNLSVATTTPTIIYQIIERAVPGPQGPQGIVGPQGPMGPSGRDSSTIASFFPNTAVGGQYLGYGNGSSANPTGTGNLSALNVSGDSAFGGKITGAGLLSCNTLTSKILYNSTTSQFECGTDQGGSGFSGGDITVQNLFATTSLYTPVVYASTSNASTSNINTATITNLFVPNALLTFATLTSATSTNIYSTNASISAATTTNFFSSILNSLTSTFINLLFTNATGTNATTTNFFTTNLNSLGNFVLGTGTIASTTITDANITNASVNLATFTSGTSTN